MSKKANSIYRFENSIKIQKMKCLLKLGFNRAEKNQDKPCDWNKIGH